MEINLEFLSRCNKTASVDRVSIKPVINMPVNPSSMLLKGRCPFLIPNRRADADSTMAADRPNRENRDVASAVAVMLDGKNYKWSRRP